MMEFVSTLFKEVLNITIISSVLILIILLIRLLFGNKLTSKTYYFLWILLLIQLVFPFRIESSLSLENHISELENISVNNYESESELPDSTSKPVDAAVDTENRVFQDDNTQKVESNDWYDRILSYGSILWLFGILTVILIPIVSYIVLKQELKLAEVADGGDVVKASVRIRRLLGISDTPKLVYSNISSTPALIGVLNPMIVLSEDAREYDYDKIYSVLIHEFVHLKKKHLLIQWLFWVVKSIFWFNPLIWLVHSLMKQDAECWCDQEVLRLMDSEQANVYGNLILDMAVHRKDPVFNVSAAGFGNKSSEIKKRIVKIARGEHKSGAAVVAVICIMVIAIPVFFTSRNSSSAEQRVEKIVEEELLVEQKDSLDKSFKIKPYKYKLDTKKQELMVYMDYELNDSLLSLKEQMTNITLYAKLEFPGSVHPEIREKSIRGTPVEDSENNFIGFRFELKDYDKQAYGMAKLVFEGAQIEVDKQLVQKSFDLTRDKIPYSITYKDIAEVTFSKMAIDTKKKCINYIVEVKTLTGIETEPHIRCSVGGQISSRASGSISSSNSGGGTASINSLRGESHSGKVGGVSIINQKAYFTHELDEDTPVHMDIISLTLFVNRMGIKDDAAWRFNID